MTARSLVKLLYASLVLFGSYFPLAVSAATGAEPLLQQSDLKYQGAFRLPVGATDPTSFAFGGSGLAYNPARDSLFMVGHIFYQLSAEFNIPTVVNSTDLNNLQTATLLQPFADTSDGNLANLATFAGEKVYNAGQLVYNNRLIGAAYTQSDPSQVGSHFTSALDLSLTNDFQGFYQVGSVGQRFVSGYMGHIPQDWQAEFGGTALTGGCCNPPDIGAINVGAMSWGPSAFVFDPDDLGVSNPVAATPIVYYYPTNPTLGEWGNTSVANPALNLMTYVTGVVFPKGTRTVLFFGNTGTGIPCFGNGTDDPALDRAPWVVNGTTIGILCYDPLEVDGGFGPHAFPYAYHIWAYDVQDLLAARNGQVNPWDVLPYDTWTLTLPFDGDRRIITGAAYDASTDKIYISQGYGDANGMPVIHVFNVQVDGLVKPLPPSGLSVE